MSEGEVRMYSARQVVIFLGAVALISCLVVGFICSVRTSSLKEEIARLSRENYELKTEVNKLKSEIGMYKAELEMCNQMHDLAVQIVQKDDAIFVELSNIFDLLDQAMTCAFYLDLEGVIDSMYEIQESEYRLRQLVDERSRLVNAYNTLAGG